MSYISAAELAKRFAGGDLKAWTDDLAAGAVDTTVIAEVLAQVDGMINGAAGQFYTTPLRLSDAGTADVVKLHAGSLAGYLLASRRQGDVSNTLQTLYEDAKKWLELVRKGMTLAGETPAAVTRPTGGIVIAGGASVITRETMEGL
jgi:phage gp36-like protein